MRTKVTLVLIFLNVALFFFIFKFERNWRTEAASMEARRRVLGAEAADIRRLEVATPNHTGEFGLRRERDSWILTKPLDWPANPYTANSIVTALQLLEHEATFAVADLAKNSQSLADYGLDNPKMTVTFSSGDAAAAAGAGPTTVLKIGDTTRDGKRVYVLSPNGDRVHVVSRAKIEPLWSPIELLRADTLFSVKIFEARSLGVQTAAAANTAEPGRPAVALRVRIRRDPAGNRWRFETPINAPASRTEVELAVNALQALHAKSFPAASTAPSPSSAPSVRVSLEGNNLTETLFLGDVVPNAKAPAGSTEYYAQLEGRSALFTVVVPNALLDKLRNAQETLREKRILDFDPRAVTAVTLSAPVQPNIPAITLQRLDPAAGQAREVANWQIVRRGDGAQGLRTLPADTAAVQRLLDRLSLLSADKFKSDAPTSADLEEWGFNRPAREISLSLAGGAPLVLRLGTDASRNVYARVGGPTEAGTSIYSVGPEIIDAAPLSPLAWRDRAIGEPLPAQSKISALKLTDLATNQVLFETTMAANGEATPAARDPQALQNLLAALRNLRAKEFVPGGFTEKVAAGAEDRPWRFQLDATITPPGEANPAQNRTLTLVFTERIGGNLQFAGSKLLDVVFSVEQPVIDALWSLAYGPRDPGPPAEKK